MVGSPDSGGDGSVEDQLTPVYECATGWAKRIQKDVASIQKRINPGDSFGHPSVLTELIAAPAATMFSCRTASSIVGYS